MNHNKIFYRSGYKYQLAKDCIINTDLKPKKGIGVQFIRLEKTGRLTVKSGYAWDGTSGSVMGTNQNQRASLIHDALYQLMRQRKLSPRKNYKDNADKIFCEICKKDGVSSAIASVYCIALKKFGKASTDFKNARETSLAP